MEGEDESQGKRVDTMWTESDLKQELSNLSAIQQTVSNLFDGVEFSRLTGKINNPRIDDGPSTKNKQSPGEVESLRRVRQEISTLGKRANFLETFHTKADEDVDALLNLQLESLAGGVRSSLFANSSSSPFYNTSRVMSRTRTLRSKCDTTDDTFAESRNCPFDLESASATPPTKFDKAPCNEDPLAEWADRAMGSLVTNATMVDSIPRARNNRSLDESVAPPLMFRPLLDIAAPSTHSATRVSHVRQSAAAVTRQQSPGAKISKNLLPSRTVIYAPVDSTWRSVRSSK